MRPASHTYICIELKEKVWLLSCLYALNITAINSHHAAQGQEQCVYTDWGGQTGPWPQHCWAVTGHVCCVCFHNRTTAATCKDWHLTEASEREGCISCDRRVRCRKFPVLETYEILNVKGKNKCTRIPQRTHYTRRNYIICQPIGSKNGTHSAGHAG